jgi:glycerol-3-phosphate acyltransferase PlsY
LAVLGHVTTPWAGFKGGKGVATGAGAAAVLMPGPLLLAAAVFVLVFIAGRIVSLASLAFAVTRPVALGVLGGGGEERPWLLAWGVVVAVLVVLRHAANIRRLLRGEEPRWRRATERR